MDTRTTSSETSTGDAPKGRAREAGPKMPGANPNNGTAPAQPARPSEAIDPPATPRPESGSAKEARHQRIMGSVGAPKMEAADGKVTAPPAGAGARDDQASATAELQTRYDSLVREQLEIVRERNHLARQLAAVPRASRDLSERLVEMEQATLSIRQARDLLLTRNHELIDELARADDKIAELGFESDDAQTARDAAIKERDERAAECEALRHNAHELSRQMASWIQDEKNYVTQLAEALQHIEELTDELSAAQTLAAERAQQIEALRVQSQSQPAPPSPAVTETPTVIDKSDARQKRNVAVMAGQFAAAQRGREAALAEAQQARAEAARLVAERETLRTDLATVRDTFEKQIAALRAQLAAQEAPAPGVERTRAEASPRADLPAVVVDSAPGKADAFPDAAATLEKMCACVEALGAQPDQLDPLEVLDGHLRAFSDHAHTAGNGAVHRYTLGCRELTRWLRKTPKKISATLPTLNQAIGLLGVLTMTSGENRVADPAGALVYSVDDDVDNCECIASALEKMTLFTKYAAKPEVALAELTAIPCDLIILDVNMPGMDGFELCGHIRKIAHHRKTPILFVSGLMSAKVRLEGIEKDNIEFIAKPYNLIELSLKALTMILTPRWS